MTTTALEQDYVQAVAGEVRAMMARRSMKGRELAEVLGHDAMWVSRRVRGATPWTGAELIRLAQILHCRPSDLLPHLDSNQEHFDYQSRQEDDYPFRDCYELAA